MRQPTLKFVLGLSLACIFVYAFAIPHGFVGWDDTDHLHNNPHLNPVSISGILALWFAPFFNMYIPLTYTVWGVLLAVVGYSPAVFHTTNVLLHTTNAILVFLILRSLLRELALRQKQD